jgi:hypothetical protein
MTQIVRVPTNRGARNESPKSAQNALNFKVILTVRLVTFPVSVAVIYLSLYLSLSPCASPSLRVSLSLSLSLIYISFVFFLCLF